MTGDLESCETVGISMDDSFYPEVFETTGQCCRFYCCGGSGKDELLEF